MKLRSSIAFAAMFAASVLPAISMAQGRPFKKDDKKQEWKKDGRHDNGRWDKNDRKDDRRQDSRWDNNRRDDNSRWGNNRRDDNWRWDNNRRDDSRWDNNRRDDNRWDSNRYDDRRWDNNGRYDQDRRQQKQNEWRNIAIGAGAIGLLGLLQKDNTLAIAGGVGALYSYWRYEQDRKSSNPYDRARARYFDHDHFYRDGVRYERRDVNKNGQRYYQFVRC